MTSLGSQDFPFSIVPLGAFGAEIVGINLSTMTDADARVLQIALARFQVLVFRGQGMTPDAQLSLTRHFGMLEPGIARRPEGHQVPGHPGLLHLSNASGSPTYDYGMGWHSDGLAYARKPHGVTMLHCIDCPSDVGDTLFASQYLAYRSLSSVFRQVIAGLYWHLPEIPFSEIPPERGLAQPIVRIHPQTDRPFLFCSPASRQILGMTLEESTSILDVVHRSQVREDVVYRHAWRKLDVVIWENCALLHNRADVVDAERQGLRVMHRSATSGDYEAIDCAASKPHAVMASHPK
jgi:taurine dioxygenase